MDFDSCPCSGKTLIKLVKPLIMAALARRTMHGYELKNELVQTVFAEGDAPDLSGIYRCMNEMEKKGLVVSQWSAEGMGPARRRYSLTPDGHDCLARWNASLANFKHQLDITISYLNSTATLMAQTPGETSTAIYSPEDNPEQTPEVFPDKPIMV